MPGRKTPAADRARRLLAMLRHLRPGHPVPLSTLAEVSGATPEELAEDLRRLSLCGVAPYSPCDLVDVWLEEDGLVHAYSPHPALDQPVRLSPSEGTALLAALQMCGSGADDPLVRKVAGAAAVDLRPEEVERLVRSAVEPRGMSAVYEAVAAAARDHRSLRILYYSAGRGGRSERVIRPYALGNDRGVWYVSAHCERVGAVRTFRLDRILDMHATGETFQPPDHVEPPIPAFESSGLPVAEIRFSPGEVISRRDWPGADFETSMDGSVVGRVPFSTPEWVARRVAARLGGAEVLGPPEVREAVVRIAGESAR